MDYLSKYLGRFENYSDDGYYQAGAYGPRVIDQIPYVLYVMEHDIETRQAVINIWRDRPYKSVDIPCTLSLQFLARGGVMDTIVNMRSSDAYMGLIYDTFCFSMISLAVANLMELEVGETTIFMGSSHLYHRNIDAAKELILDPGEVNDHYNDFKTQHPAELVRWLEDVAESETPLRMLLK